MVSLSFRHGDAEILALDVAYGQQIKSSGDASWLDWNFQPMSVRHQRLISFYDDAEEWARSLPAAYANSPLSTIITADSLLPTTPPSASGLGASTSVASRPPSSPPPTLASRYDSMAAPVANGLLSSPPPTLASRNSTDGPAANGPPTAAVPKSQDQPNFSQPNFGSRGLVNARNKSRLITGSVLFTIGLIVTIVTYMHAASSPSGGTYLVAWGPMLGGCILILRGLAASDWTTRRSR